MDGFTVRLWQSIVLNWVCASLTLKTRSCIQYWSKRSNHYTEGMQAPFGGIKCLRNPAVLISFNTQSRQSRLHKGEASECMQQQTQDWLITNSSLLTVQSLICRRLWTRSWSFHKFITLFNCWVVSQKHSSRKQTTVQCDARFPT